ncbi:hypothetical protein ABPG74_012367 [Tetrahymena malaccensis]
MQNCRTFLDFRKQMVFSCASDVLIGDNRQRQPISFILSNPLSLSIANNMNFIFNSRCNYQNNCTYAKSNLQQANTFFRETRSPSLNVIQTNYTNNLPEGFLIKGDLDSDQFYLFGNNEAIELQFISIFNYTEKKYVGNGVFNLQNGNENSVFVQGYLQNRFQVNFNQLFNFQLLNIFFDYLKQSPIFQFNSDTLTGRLEINYDFAKDTSLPIIKTYSDNIWDVQMVGISLGDENMEAIAHYKVFIIQSYVKSALPKSNKNQTYSHIKFFQKQTIDIAKYLKKKYSEDFDSTSGDYALNNCFECQCDKNFPNLEIFTTEYKITIPIQEFTFVDDQGSCQINTSSQNLLFGMRQILSNNVIFDPLQSELQFPEAELMIHPSIDWSLVILIQSNILFAMLFVLLVKYERYSTDLKLETNQFDIKKYITQQIMVKKEVQ